MGGYSNPFLDSYYGVIRQEAERDKNRDESRYNALRMAQGIDAMAEARRQRQFANLDQMLKYEGERAQGGIEEMQGPVRPGETHGLDIGLTFKPRDTVDFGELPRGVDPAEIQRMANNRARLLETERLRKIRGEDVGLELQKKQDTRADQAAKIAAENARVQNEYHRAQIEHLLHPTPRTPTPKSFLDAVRIAGAFFDDPAQAQAYAKEIWAEAQRLAGGGGNTDAMLGELRKLNAMTIPQGAAKPPAAAAASITPQPGTAPPPGAPGPKPAPGALQGLGALQGTSADELRRQFELSQRAASAGPLDLSAAVVAGRPQFDAKAMNAVLDAELAKNEEKRRLAAFPQGNLAAVGSGLSGVANDVTSGVSNALTGAFTRSYGPQGPPPQVQPLVDRPAPPHPAFPGQRLTPQAIDAYMQAAGGDQSWAEYLANKDGWNVYNTGR